MAFHVLDGLGPVPDAVKGAVIAIGNFDGCHRGHQTVFRHAIDRARALDAPALMLTFEPHPRDVFAPEPFMFRLTEGDMKARLAEALGFNGIVVMPFTRDLSQVSAEDFVDQRLIGALALKGAVVGADFHFGRKRAGTPQFLKESGDAKGFEVTIMDMLDEGDAPVSSSRIREALTEGRVEDANALLGYHHLLAGRVIHGDKRGRELGYPTANIAQSLRCNMKHGVYAVKVRHAGRTYDAVASYGRRPMFDNGEALLEVHVFDFKGDLYGSTLEVALIDYLRDEEKFASLEDLIAAMDRDSANARAAIAAARPISALDEKLGIITA